VVAKINLQGGSSPALERCSDGTEEIRVGRHLIDKKASDGGNKGVLVWRQFRKDQHQGGTPQRGGGTQRPEPTTDRSKSQGGS